MKVAEPAAHPPCRQFDCTLKDGPLSFFLHLTPQAAAIKIALLSQLVMLGAADGSAQELRTFAKNTADWLQVCARPSR